MLQNQLTSARVIRRIFFSSSSFRLAFMPLYYPLSLFSFMSMCFTESIHQLKSEPKEMRRQKKETKKNKKNLTLPLYAQFTQWINSTTFTAARYVTFHFIFFISCNKYLSSKFLMPNSLSDFYVNFPFIPLFRIIKKQSFENILLFASLPSAFHRCTTSGKNATQTIIYQYFVSFNFTHKTYMHGYIPIIESD